MGTILASAIISKASIVLQDTTNVRWPLTELLGWLNDGQREICAVIPELTATVGLIVMVVGSKQSLPAAGIALLGNMRNMGTSGTTIGNAIRKVPRDILDSQVPGWHAATAVTDLKHYTYDPRDPRHFYVYPPSVVSNNVEALYTISPPDLGSSSTAIGIDDIYQNMLLEYVVYRAYSKDLEMAGNAERAQMHLGRFQGMLGSKKGVDTALQPTDMIKG